MKAYGGFLFIVDEPARADVILIHRDVLEANGRPFEFTDVVSGPDWHLKQREVCLLSIGGDSIDYAALTRRGARVATGKYRITFTDLVDIGGLPLDAVKSAMAKRYRLHFVSSSTGGGDRIPPATWSHLLDIVRRLKPGCASDLVRLENMRQLSTRVFRGKGHEITAQEKDALGLALDLFGMERRQILTAWEPPAGDSPAPFVRGLSALALREDTVIDHDARSFADWSPDFRQDIIGIVEFTKGDEKLTVVNANRTPVERSLGVDLIYYHHRYGSYVMVQYKMMSKKDNGVRMFRVGGKAYREELKRMEEFAATHVNPGTFNHPDQYRLHDGAFYMKLCPKALLEPLSSDLMHGMYLPLDYWRALCGSERALGPKGGVHVSYDNVGRYVNTSLFVDLVKAGWIGSRGTVSDALTLALRSVQAGRSVLAAMSESRHQ